MLIGFLLGVGISWSLIFNISPRSFQDQSFSLGLGAGVLLMACLAMLLMFISSKAANGESNFKAKIGLFLSALLIIISLFTYSFLSSKNSERAEEHLAQENHRRMETAKLEAKIAIQKSAWIYEQISSIKAEIRKNPDRALSEASVLKLKSLAEGLTPYYTVKGDTLSSRKYSPQKGVLLTGLNLLKIDSSSFQKILNEISFSFADLESIKYNGINLSKADLKESNLRKAKLKNITAVLTRFDEADLAFADLEKSILDSAVFSNANLRWGNLQEVQAQKSKFNAANLNNTNFYKADLRDAEMKWVLMNNASLNEADLSNAKITYSKLNRSNFKDSNLKAVDLFLCELKEANMMNCVLENAVLNLADLKNADLSNANLKEATFEKAKMHGTQLNGAKVSDPNWFDRLIDWDVEGAKKLRETYKLKQIGQDSIYELQIIEN